MRVLGREADALRLELWERGEFHGARVLSGAGENPQLFARRVALAAAELGRRLARKREAALRREARLRELREALDRSRRERTQEGPVALRSELGVAVVPGKLWLAGPRVSAELTLRGALRLDLGAEAGAGSLHTAGGAALYGATLGPAYRFVLTPWLDTDLGARAGAFLLEVPAARSLDAIPWQQGSWTALAGVAGRVELRMSRQVRASVGVEGGALLRSIAYVGDGGEQQLRGSWLSATLGVVLTPP